MVMVLGLCPLVYVLWSGVLGLGSWALGPGLGPWLCLIMLRINQIGSTMPMQGVCIVTVRYGVVCV